MTMAIHINKFELTAGEDKCVGRLELLPTTGEPAPTVLLESDESDFEDEDVPTAFASLQPHEQRIMNEIITFQEELKERFGLTGSFRKVLKTSLHDIHPPLPKPVAEKEMKVLYPDPIYVRTEAGPTRRITPILVKEEPDHCYITSDPRCFQNVLPAIPDHEFKKVSQPLDESYTDSDVTDDPDYLADDQMLPEEMDSEEAEEFKDKEIMEVDITVIETGIDDIVQGL